MNKICLLALLVLTLAACDSKQKATQQPTETNPQAKSVNIPNPTIPNPTIPKPTIPKPTIPKPTIPKPTIPQVTIPQVTFPEVTIPNVMIQQDKNTTIYTLPADVLFDFDKATIRSDAEASLQQISSSIAKRFPNARLEINGHTDSVGGDDYNLNLSKQRAESVQQWLIQNKNVKPNLLSVKGLGEAQPVSPNTNSDGSDNPQGRQKNRRVEIVVRS
jgi:outer membrane protein OmpA-like peptidoglycan-associated protein